MKCLAKIEQFPAATREKTTKVFIMSADDLLNNQKLINWRSSGEFFVSFRFVSKVYYSKWGFTCGILFYYRKQS